MQKKAMWKQMSFWIPKRSLPQYQTHHLQWFAFNFLYDNIHRNNYYTVYYCHYSMVTEEESHFILLLLYSYLVINYKS